jgi:Lon protease-like protein
MMPAFSYRKPRDLPDTIPVFPLDGALLLPRMVLPLNIFEPRYLNMVDDVLAGGRLIGMIQTRAGGPADRPALQSVGCAGRLTSFSEVPDGRYLITLTGVCRFGLDAELDAATPYRQVRADWEPFACDLAAPSLPASFDRVELLSALRAFLASNDLAADWASIENAAPDALVNSLSMVCPFDPPEKQALLEAPTLEARSEALMTLMRLRAAGPEGGAA